jgi:endonuclease YncB( thermonuclease family)
MRIRSGRFTSVAGRTVLVAVAYLSVLAGPVFGQLTGKVVSVYDGDTITALDTNKRQHKIRLAGIDAPEIKQDFGQKAKRRLSKLVFGRAVLIEGGKIDRHGRRVAKLLVHGRDACLEMIRLGLAWHY